MDESLNQAAPRDAAVKTRRRTLFGPRRSDQSRETRLARKNYKVAKL